MARQLRLRLDRSASHSRETFVAGPSNAQATAALDAWPRWPSGCLALVGPEGVGKTHLARAWAETVGARVLDHHHADVAATAGRPVLLEDVDRGVSEEGLFHLINLAPLPGGGLLLTARTPPKAWPANLPDLRSRLGALYVAEIEEPDDEVLSGVLERFFQARNIRPAPDLYPYLLRRMERSAVSAREIVQRLDEAPDELKPVSRVLARQLLERD
ncbi:MAG: chromosomal replication initiator DnaA [Phenylobacterium sp.]|nr:MAG: chromosomal replication initiator DnaA [Phenylobacterium sp.]